MRITRLTAIHAGIPLKKEVKHASFSRKENDTLLIRCETNEGHVGWGEGLPRPYVTGETIESTWEHARSLNASVFAGEISSIEELRKRLDTLVFHQPEGTRDCFGNAARCAVELAVLDAWCQSRSLSLSQLIRELPEAAGFAQNATHVRYSAAITGSSLAKVRLRSALFRLFGFRLCKVKVGFQELDDRRIVKTVRGILGRRCRIRIDANEAWAPGEIHEKLAAFDGLDVESVEQPVHHDQLSGLSGIRGTLGMKVMLDESLCSLNDGQRAIVNGTCDAFNLRLSKCGGVLRTVALMQMAHDAGLTAQLGCQVGETGILSAAGRHFASSIAGLTAVEGSFDRLLVAEPLTKEDLTFRYGGWAPALTKPGLGVTIDSNTVERVTMKTIEIALDP